MRLQGKRKWIYGLVTLLLLLTQACTMYAGPEKDMQAKVDEYLDAYSQLIHFSGAVLIAQNGKVLVDKGYGLASYENNVPVTPQTRFKIASLTKQFTAMAVLVLQERDLLNVEDKVSVYLPDYPNGDKIQLVHLLTHTSGIPDHTELPGFYDERRVNPTSVTETIATFKTLPLEFTPGEKFSYSNSGYILLGHIIESVAKMPLAEFVTKSILKPLDMNDTGFITSNGIVENLAEGYVFKDDQIMKADYRDMSNAHASGAMYSTVDDLYKWDRALNTTKLVSQESIDAMFTPYTAYYSYGWGLADLWGHSMAAHNGEIEGCRTNISRFSDDDVCIIILSNLEQTPVGKMSVDMAAMVFGEEYKVPAVRKTVQVKPWVLKKYAGKYEVQPDFHFTITSQDEHIYCQATGQQKLEIFPESETKFFLKQVDAQIEFICADDGKVDKLVLHQGGHEVPAAKVE